MRHAFILAALLFPVKQKQQPTEAERLQQLAREDQEISATAIVRNASCGEHACRVTFIVKDENGFNFQLAVFRFLQKHPEFGTGFAFEDDVNDPKMTFFVIYKENTLE